MQDLVPDHESLLDKLGAQVLYLQAVKTLDLALIDDGSYQCAAISFDKVLLEVLLDLVLLRLILLEPGRSVSGQAVLFESPLKILLLRYLVVVVVHQLERKVPDNPHELGHEVVDLFVTCRAFVITFTLALF